MDPPSLYPESEQPNESPDLGDGGGGAAPTSSNSQDRGENGGNKADLRSRLYLWSTKILVLLVALALLLAAVIWAQLLRGFP